jgi:hypothetical protein
MQYIENMLALIVILSGIGAVCALGCLAEMIAQNKDQRATYYDDN